MESWTELLIFVGAIVGAIIIIVLFNKLLDYLSNRFPIPYYIFTILVAGTSFGLSFYLYDLGSATAQGFKVFLIIGLLYFIYMYLILTELEDSEYTTQEQKTDWDGNKKWYKDGTPVMKTENHYHPAFLRKIGFSLLGAVIMILSVGFINLSWIAFVLQLIFPVLMIIKAIRDR